MIIVKPLRGCSVRSGSLIDLDRKQRRKHYPKLIKILKIKKLRKLKKARIKIKRNMLPIEYSTIHCPKARAREIAHKALKRGLITKKPCEKCGKEKVLMHHEDYSKPLQITFLCNSCHRFRHGILAKQVQYF